MLSSLFSPRGAEALWFAAITVRRPEKCIRSSLFFLILPAVGCAATTKEPTIPSPGPNRPAFEAEEATGAPELTIDEEQLRQDLTRHVEELATKIGERNADESWQLAEASDYIAAELEAMGYPLERQGYETKEVAAQNLSVTVPGGIRGDETLHLGVHYDSPLGSRGRDGAADVAVVLELARLMRRAEIFRSLKFSFFAMGESPHGDGEARGARQYLRSLKQPRDAAGYPPGTLPEISGSRHKTIGFISFDGLGALRAEKDKSGSFVTRVGCLLSPGSEVMRRSLFGVLSDEGTLLEEMSFSDFSGSQEDSDPAAFYAEGVPVAVVSGRLVAGAIDEKEHDLSQTARIAMKMRWALGQIVQEKMGNDAMLTPGSSVLR